MSSNSSITVRYDGPALSGHQMDVSDLAPALIGLSELYKHANTKCNGNKAAVKVLISTDTEHQCFQFDIQIVQGFWDQAKTLLKDTDIASAKELGEWLGLIGGGGATAVYGLFKLLKWLDGRKVNSSELKIESGLDSTKITVIGSNNSITVYPRTLELAEDQTTLKNVYKVIKPITKDDYESLEFEHGDETEMISSEDAGRITNTVNVDAEEQFDEPQVVSAWITVYAPVYDPTVKSWRFKYGETHYYMDISDTNIAEDAINRGGALIDDTYFVRLEIRQEHTSSGRINNHYKIMEVLDFKPANISAQSEMFKVSPENPVEDNPGARS